MTKGELRALVSGSEIYEVLVRIDPLAPARWKRARKECSGQIGTIVELLSGQLSTEVMAVLCHREKGLLPGMREIRMSCSCPDGVMLCKHLAAVLYGVGARLDQAPELLFTLRGVDGAELIADAGKANGLAPANRTGAAIDDEQLGEIFGIELETKPSRPARKPGKPGKVFRKKGRKARRALRRPS